MRERLTFARKSAANALQPGTGRNPKASRMSRQKAEQAETELERRELTP